MEDNQCPTCKAELAANQECANCGTGSPGQSGLTAGGDLLDGLRNVTPLPPGQAPQALPKNDPGEKQRPRIDAPPDPGSPFYSKEIREAEEFAKILVRQNANKKQGGQNRAAGRDYTERKTKIINKHYHESRERRSESATVSLMDLTARLPDRERQIPGKASYNVDPHVGKLTERHVIFMSCIDEEVAVGAAYALLDELHIATEQRLLLSFARNAEKSNAVIQLFSQLSSDDHRERTAIVIDGFSVEARTFVDWLHKRTAIGASEVRNHLHGHGFYLLCLVAPSYLESYSGTQTFATWPVPFLQPLLKHRFPLEADWLEKQIRVQQQSGKWKQTDAELCSEIRGLLDHDLPKIVEQRREMPIVFTPPEADSAAPPERLFKGGQSIEDTLLYAATYFYDLPPHEFDQLVDWLLADRTTTITVKTQHHNADGTIQIIETEAQKPLKDFWNADPDSYLTSCEIEATTGPNPTTIRFANETRREKLKTHLERHHSMYLQRQFRLLESHKFLTSAPHISDRAMSLSLDMATAYPSSFGKEWLLKIILEARNGSRPWPNADNATVSFGKNKALERITLFVRLMLERPQLEEVVSGLLKDLMSLGNHETVLYLVRGLQFAPGFDEFYWIKRLLDEGEASIKDDAYYHLYSYIQKIGIHPLLSKLESWIPTDDRPLYDYSPSCIFSLRALVEYCSELSETFEQEETPARHPLFTFTDETVARENCRRLVRWLFHPGMPSVFAELDSLFDDERPEARVLPFICELVLEWMVVLRDQESSLQESSVGSEQFLSTERTQDFLIESLAANTFPNQRAQMLLYWERLRDVMGFVVNLSASSDWISSLNLEEKRALLTTRRVVKDLIKRFRTAIRAARQRNAKVLTTV